MIKPIVISLLSLTLLASIASFAVSFNTARLVSGSQEFEYLALNAAEMDNIGFRAVAKEEGLAVSEAGEITFPKEIADKIIKERLLPHTIHDVERNGGWKFVAVTSDNYYLFRRPRSKASAKAPASKAAPEANAEAPAPESASEPAATPAPDAAAPAPTAPAASAPNEDAEKAK